MVVVPAVAGALLGRRLDERVETGIFWTLSLLVFGAMIGSASAWRHVRGQGVRRMMWLAAILAGAAIGATYSASLWFAGVPRRRTRTSGDLAGNQLAGQAGSCRLAFLGVGDSRS